MTEAEWQEQFLEMAHLLGWEHLHVRRSIGKGQKWTTATNVVGWPDLLLWSGRQPGRHLAIEMKSKDGVVSPEQKAVLASLAASGFETFVLRPADLERARDILAVPRTPGGR